MGDVVTALARAVQEEGHRVDVIVPKYDCIQYDQVRERAVQYCMDGGGGGRGGRARGGEGRDRATDGQKIEGGEGGGP